MEQAARLNHGTPTNAREVDRPVTVNSRPPAVCVTIRHFTASAVVLDDQDRVLLVHHNK
jgi:hypothetical protein